MKQLLKQNFFNFTVNQAFEQVISHCKTIRRKDQHGTWITNDVKKAYTDLYKHGFAQSAEVWKNGELLGGLYGVKLGNIFFGESMFSKQSNASKYALIKFNEYLKSTGVELIDCQIYTEHLERFGARMISRKAFTHKLKEHITLLNGEHENLVRVNGHSKSYR